jgi:nitroreductase
MKKIPLLLLATAFATSLAFGDAPKPAAPAKPIDAPSTIDLPPPAKSGGTPVLTAMAKRKSARAFADQALTPQQMSDLLWSAAGVSRADGRRTAPSARNNQEVSVYAVTAAGAWLYDGANNKLVSVAGGDRRALTGTAEFVKIAAVDLVYVFDEARAGGKSPRDLQWGAVSAGAMCQNVYLYCTSENLACVARGSFDAGPLAAALQLKPGQTILITQSVGVPAK